MLRIENMKYANVEGLRDMPAYCSHEVEVFCNDKGCYRIDAGCYWQLIPEEDKD